MAAHVDADVAAISASASATLFLAFSTVRTVDQVLAIATRALVFSFVAFEFGPLTP